MKLGLAKIAGSGKMTQAHNIAIQILGVCNDIAKRKLQNKILFATWEKIVFPFFLRQVKLSTEQEITRDLNLIYAQLKPFINKKQIKDSIDEANNISDIQIPSIFLREERKYF